MNRDECSSDSLENLVNRLQGIPRRIPSVRFATFSSFFLPPLLSLSDRAVSFSGRGLARSKPLDSKEREKERKTIFVYFPLKKLFFDKDRSLVSSYTIRKRAEENVASFSGRKHWPHAFQKKRVSVSHRDFKIFFRYRAIAIHVQFFY